MHLKENVDKAFRLGEDIVYCIIGLLLLLTALFLIINSCQSLFISIFESDYVQVALHVMERMLLTIMILEILYTVRVSLKTHTLCAEPFFIVGIIAAVRRILVIGVESAYVLEKFEKHMIEMGVLSFVILILVFSIYMLRKKPESSAPDCSV